HRCGQHYPHGRREAFELSNTTDSYRVKQVRMACARAEMHRLFVPQVEWRWHRAESDRLPNRSPIPRVREFSTRCASWQRLLAGRHIRDNQHRTIIGGLLESLLFAPSEESGERIPHRTSMCDDRRCPVGVMAYEQLELRF